MATNEHQCPTCGADLGDAESDHECAGTPPEAATTEVAATTVVMPAQKQPQQPPPPTPDEQPPPQPEAATTEAAATTVVMPAQKQPQQPPPPTPDEQPPPQQGQPPEDPYAAYFRPAPGPPAQAQAGASGEPDAGAAATTQLPVQRAYLPALGSSDPGGSGPFYPDDSDGGAAPGRSHRRHVMVGVVACAVLATGGIIGGFMLASDGGPTHPVAVATPSTTPAMLPTPVTSDINPYGDSPTPTVSQTPTAPTTQSTPAPPAGSGSTSSAPPNLSLGSSGSRVADVQRWLRQLHLYRGKVNGRYGVTTAAGVAAFQFEHGVSGDPPGEVGPNTWQALRSAA